MNIYLICNYPVVVDGIISMISLNYSNILTYETLAEALNKNLSDKDIIIYPLIIDYLSEINKVLLLKKSYPLAKVLVIDFNNGKDNFFKFSKAGIEGYLLGNFTKDDILCSLSRLSKGSKFYDEEILYHLIDEDNRFIDIGDSKSILTNREREVLAQIAKGLSNIQISYKLKISENTVKKHISNIFLKLNVTDRTQATIYAYKNGLLLTENN